MLLWLLGCSGPPASPPESDVVGVWWDDEAAEPIYFELCGPVGMTAFSDILETVDVTVIGQRLVLEPVDGDARAELTIVGEWSNRSQLLDGDIVYEPYGPGGLDIPCDLDPGPDWNRD